MVVRLLPKQEVRVRFSHLAPYSAILNGRQFVEIFMFKKRELIQFSRDRMAMSLLIAFLLSMVLLLIWTFFNIHVSDVQLPVRVSGYGSTFIYRDRWYSLLSYALFAILVGGLNSYLIIKLHANRRGLSLGFALVSLTIGIIALVVAAAVFRLAALSL